MAKKPKQTLTPEEVAEQSKKGWKAVTVPQADVSPGDAPDAVAPEMDVLKKRYGIADKATIKKAKKPGEISMVVVEAPADSDTRAGRKVVLVQDGKNIGEQG